MQRLLQGLRRPDTCVVCGTDLPAGATAWWDARAKAVTCAVCYEADAPDGVSSAPVAELDRGRAAASVGRDYRRRRDAREAEVRADHPHIAGLLLKVGRTPQREAALRSGEMGELVVGEVLEKRHARGSLFALQDRRVPGRQSNIDHIAVAPTGVYVIDAKQYSGKVRREDRGFRGSRLMINGRDRTKLLVGLDLQAAVVREALVAGGRGDVRVQGVLCFTTGDLPSFKVLEIGGHLVVGVRRLGKQLDANGSLLWSAIEEIAGVLADALPPKVTVSEP